MEASLLSAVRFCPQTLQERSGSADSCWQEMRGRRKLSPSLVHIHTKTTTPETQVCTHAADLYWEQGQRLETLVHSPTKRDPLSSSACGLSLRLLASSLTKHFWAELSVRHDSADYGLCQSCPSQSAGVNPPLVPGGRLIPADRQGGRCRALMGSAVFKQLHIVMFLFLSPSFSPSEATVFSLWAKISFSQ